MHCCGLQSADWSFYSSHCQPYTHSQVNGVCHARDIDGLQVPLDSIDIISRVVSELKMPAPGMSSQAFLRMLDQRTVGFGLSGNITADSFRKSFLEWEAVRFELDKLCQEDHFDCPACSPDMLAVSIDGNLKHYRFKSAARSEEQAIFDGVFIANDDDVARLVDYVHTSTSHVSGRGVCGGQWSAARETSQKSSGKTDEEGLELAVCGHGVLLRALNMFRVEIFAYPLYFQKQMACKPVTFFAMDLACKYWPYLRRVTEKCPELQDLLTMRPFLSVFHAKAHDFKCKMEWSISGGGWFDSWGRGGAVQRLPLEDCCYRKAHVKSR
ncbi:uncharacterized protein LOC143759151 [Siphateles boraxobius]|uniref:uncharacterized protein LOC143759151 n=1 Tax=Siphateles boraxobius TaxID=180520 RepID=UPI0040638E2C